MLIMCRVWISVAMDFGGKIAMMNQGLRICILLMYDLFIWAENQVVTGNAEHILYSTEKLLTHGTAGLGFSFCSRYISDI